MLTESFRTLRRSESFEVEHLLLMSKLFNFPCFAVTRETIIIEEAFRKLEHGC